MKLKEYLSMYTALQTSIQNDEKLLGLVESEKCSFLLSRLNTEGNFSGEGKESLSGLVYDAEQLRRRLRKKNRLYEKYTLRIKKAAELIEAPLLKSYIIYRYLYGFNAQKIADINFYSERHIYRKAQQARRELYLGLLKVMPKGKGKQSPKRYRIVCGLENVKKHIRPGLIPRKPPKKHSA